MYLLSHVVLNEEAEAADGEEDVEEGGEEIPPQKEKEGDKEGEKEEEATKKPKDVEAEEKCGKTTDEKVKM